MAIRWAMDVEKVRGPGILHTIEKREIRIKAMKARIEDIGAEDFEKAMRWIMVCDSKEAQEIRQALARFADGVIPRNTGTDRIEQALRLAEKARSPVSAVPKPGPVSKGDLPF